MQQFIPGLIQAPRYRRRFALGLACTAGSTLVALAAPWILKLAIDDIQYGASGVPLAAHLALLLAMAVVGAGARYGMRNALLGVSRTIESDVRRDLFVRFHRMPMDAFERWRTGDLMSRATADVNAIRMLTGPVVLTSSSTVLLVTCAIGLMLSIDARLTGVVLAPLIGMSATVKWLGHAVAPRLQNLKEQAADLNSTIHESLVGIRLARAHKQERTQLLRFERQNDNYLRRQREVAFLESCVFPAITLFTGIAALASLWFGSRRVVNGSLTLGGFVAFSSYVWMLAGPMTSVGAFTSAFYRGRASEKRISEILKEPIEEDVPASHPTMSGQIDVRQLSVTRGNRRVLTDITLSVRPGEVLGIVGPVGSGKSTLAKLLTGEDLPPRGTVFMDGRDICDIPRAMLRDAVASVPQDTFLFSDTVAANVTLGCLDNPRWLSDSARHDLTVESVAEVAQLSRDVGAFESRYDTLVGERGLTLSGGQKQRIAIARALIRNAQVLLFDDAFSAIDAKTERDILARLRPRIAGRTAIIVSHRVGTVQSADRIVVLDDGHIVETGTPAELLRGDGAYAAMYRQQVLDIDETKASCS